jgi:hypothetical protein
MQMNKLIIGLAEKTDALQTKVPFLLIYDGPICDAFHARCKWAKLFDPKETPFNPSASRRKGARDFGDLIHGKSGENTVTVRNGKRALQRLVLKVRFLDRIKYDSSDAPQER